MSRAGKYDYSDAYIVERLRELAAQSGGVLTIADYARMKGPDDPSAPTIVVRRKWSEWTELAGIQSGRDVNLRTTVEKRFDFDDSVEALMRFYAHCAENGLRMTHHNYEIWQRDHDDAPCGSTCRYRLRDNGLSWSQAVLLVTRAVENDQQPVSSDAGGAASA